MKKNERRPANVRTVVPNVAGQHGVSDEWPPASYSGKYFLKASVYTCVVEGEVYVEEYAPGKNPTTARHRAGDTFVQNPNTVYAIGSVYGANTFSFSKNPINPIFIPSVA
jgi:hypothetical protein